VELAGVLSYVEMSSTSGNNLNADSDEEFVECVATLVLYVIILSAALDLVPPSTPKGITAFCNIAPALVAKVGWPYILMGRIRYTKRLVTCCILSSAGMLVCSLAPPTYSACLLFSCRSLHSLIALP
jgi:hypothetical protein